MKRAWGSATKKWCDNYIDFSEAKIGFGTEQAELSGTVFYLLRCAFLHSGNDDILNQTAAKKLKITSFELFKPDGLNGYGFTYIVDGQQTITKVDMVYVCDLICDAVERYYNSHPNKSDFDGHRCMIK